MVRTPFIRMLAIMFIPLPFALPSSGCREEAGKPDTKVGFSIDGTAGKLQGLAMDDAFLAALDELKAEATGRQDPAAVGTLARFQVAAFAAVAVNPGLPGAQRLMGGNPRDDQSRSRYLTAVLEALKATQKAPEAVEVVADLASLFGAGGTRDLTKLVEFTGGDAELAPAARLAVARKVLDALSLASEAPETERGQVVTGKLPGLPSPPTRSPAATMFPATMSLLANLLGKGAGKESGLAPYYERLKTEAAQAFGTRVFALPVGLDPNPRPGTPLAGVSGGFNPLACMTLQKDGLFLGARPAIGWENGRAVDLAGRVGWPGGMIAQAEELDDPKPTMRERMKDAFDKALSAIGGPEARAYPRFAGKGALNADRGDRGRAVLVAAEGAVPASRLKVSLASASGLGLTDLRLVPPGQPGVVLPVFYQKVPEVPGQEAPRGPRLIVALTAAGADVYAPGKAAERLPVSGWPEGARVVLDQKKFFKLAVAWNADKGFWGSLARAAAQMRKVVGAGAVAEVVVRTKEPTSAMVLDAVAELMASEGEVFSQLAAFFPGLECAQGARCPSMVPVLFSEAALPKPSKPEDQVVKDERPAGFCDKRNVEGVMRSRSGAVRACYERELQRHGEMEGRVDVRFTIEAEGTISGLAVTQNTTGSKAIEECVRQQLSNLKFAKPEGGICVIRWPFVFKPN